MSATEQFSDLEQQEARLERALAVFSASDQGCIREALAFARTAHRGQQRKWRPIPYIIHPIRVASSLIEELDVRDADTVISALLHDVVEDCDVPSATIEQQFGTPVRRTVDALTWEPGRAVKWEQAERQLRDPLPVRRVRVADILDNCRDLAAGCTADHAAALRLLYGYAHWGMRLAERVCAEAVRLLQSAIADASASCSASAPEPPCAANEGKELAIETQNEKLKMQNKKNFSSILRSTFSVLRFPIRTHLITPSDNLTEVIRQYALPYLRPGDLLAISERIVAITQGRAFRMEDIHPSRWARFFVRFVTKSPYGIGLARPETMELAIREAGLSRILLAAGIAAITKPLGVRGMFYRVVGKHINAIDGPCEYTLPIPFWQQGSGAAGQQGGPPLPQNFKSQISNLKERGRGERYAKLGPKDPNRVATNLAREIGVDVAIIDANDLGVNVLGTSEGVDRKFVRAVFKDNPLGQSSEQTPMAIVRSLTPDP